MKKLIFSVCLAALSLGYSSCDLFTSDGDGGGDGSSDALLHMPKACVAFQESDGGTGVDIIVKCREGLGDWQQLGGALNESGDSYGHLASTVIDEGGVIYVAWVEAENATGNNYIYVKRWDEDKGVWKLVGGSVASYTPATAVAGGGGVARGILSVVSTPSLSIGRDGTLGLAYTYYGLFTELYVRRWNGTEWELVGSNYLNVGDYSAYTTSLAVRNSGLMYVAWEEYDSSAMRNRAYVKRWMAGNSWTLLGGKYLNTSSDTYAYSPTIALDSDGVPYVTFNQYMNPGYRILCRRWDGNQGKWVALDGDIDYGDYSHHGFVAVGHQGLPWVLWQENYLYYLKRWDGSTWNGIGGAINSFDGTDWPYWNSGSLSLVQPTTLIDPIPCAAWAQENAVDIYQALVSCWDGQAWLPPESLNINTSNPANMPSIAGY